ncbi:glycosyltransferase family 25 [Yasminevirus sp. GU-2018]|uniref:Glycosyltransferase family 25 n=1 Tax=Yasminevirus sp. GU-2018 TaxID=2420051 RepID=A0A5K0U7I3_9VIRU|nr:glycosyltransferase family 25 [Yasminevirus sp. GU-2018]
MAQRVDYGVDYDVDYDVDHSVNMAQPPTKINDFDRIFYINLDRRPERDSNVKAQLKNAGLLQIAERVSAVDGSKLDLDMVKPIITKKGVDDALGQTNAFGISLTRGAIGCAMSHRSIWIRIRDDPEVKSALILEDDIDIDRDFIRKFNKYRRFVPLNYDVLFLGYHPASMKYFSKDENQAFVRSEKVYGLFGYIVTKQGAEKLLKMFPISEQVDTALYKCVNKYGVNAYLLKPELRLITSEPSEVAKKFGSDIQQIKEGFPSDSVVTDMTYLLIVVALALLITMLIRTLIDPKSAEV